MALVASQAGTASWASVGTKSITVSVSAGDVLAVVVGAGDPATTVTNITDNLGGTWTAGPSTPVGTGNLRGVTFWKVCAGGETSVSFDIGTGTTGQAFAVKVTGFTGTATLEASNENEASIASAVTSLGSNAASNSTASAVAIALFTADRNDTVDGGGTRNYTNSFTEVGFNSTSGSRAGAFAAAKILSSAASQSTTFSVTDTGDEMYGAILVFGDVTGSAPSEGSGTVSGTGTLPGQGYRLSYGSGSCSATGTLPSEGRTSHYGSGSCSATGTLPGEGLAPSATSEGSGSVSGVGTLPAEGYRLSFGNGSIEAIGSLPSEGENGEVSTPQRSSAGKRPGRIIGYVSPEPKDKKEKKEKKAKKAEVVELRPKKDDDYKPVAPLGGALSNIQRAATAYVDNNPYELVNAAVAMVLEAIDPMQDLKPFVDKLIAEASAAREVAEEAKMIAQEKILRQLEKEEAQKLSQSEIESLLLLMVVE